MRGELFYLKRFLFTVVLLAMILLSIYYSVLYARFTARPDFTAFYYAASVILDPTVPNTAIYDYNKMYDISPKYGISQQAMPYIYSVTIAYLLSPLALMPYETAKVVWSLINLLTYIVAVAIVLRLGQASSTWFICLMTLSLAWMPLIQNQFWLQSNAILFLLVALAVMMAIRSHPIFSGIILGIAVLFKLYPVGIALVFGLKNWRIFVACVAVFCVALFAPNSLEWFSVLDKIEYPKHITIYQLISRFGLFGIGIYALLVSGITGLVTYRTKSADYCLLACIAITAVLLILPVVWVHYYTLFMFCYAYLFALASALPRWLLFATIVSFALITFGAIYSPITATAGNFVLWVSLIYYNTVTRNNSKDSENVQLGTF